MFGVERRRMDGSGRFSVEIVVAGPKNVPDPFSSSKAQVPKARVYGDVRC